MAASTADVVSSMRKIFEKYDRIRGKHKDEFGCAFWDIVAMTAADLDQKEAFELQIEDKLHRKEIPSGVPFHVYSDPPGPKIGGGGAVMNVIAQLEATYGESLKQYRILILNAGGQSQRLPSASILGKIFTALPHGEPMYQFLDLKLAVCLPFLEHMGPGFFHVASDDILVYDLGEYSGWRFEAPGITALAHPSTIQVGRGHGVFVLKDVESMNKKLVEKCEVVEVMQKPSEEMMRKKGALIDRGKSQDFIKNGSGPIVYTDSCYFFGHDVADKLHSFYKENCPLQCEIDAYGDFMQPLGERATIDFTYYTGHVSKVEASLVETRQKIFHLLKGTDLNIVALNASKYIHLGTTLEYLHYLCSDHALAREVGFRRDVFSRSVPLKGPHGKKSYEPSSQIEGVVMHSFLIDSSVISSNAVVEYSQFSIPINVSSNAIVSNCSVHGILPNEFHQFDIPDDVFIHTIPVYWDGTTKYVTPVFDIRDDLKKKVSKENIDELCLFGRAFDKVCSRFCLDSLAEVFSDPGKPYSLWFADIFPAVDSMSESFIIAIRMINAVKSEDFVELNLKEYPKFSMSKSIERKDIATMLNYRNDLYHHITETE